MVVSIKKKAIPCFTILTVLYIFLLLTSCATGAKRASSPWYLGEYRDIWDERTGRFYVRYEEKHTASMTTPGGTQDIQITDISYSFLNGFYFKTQSSAARYGNIDVYVVIVGSDGTERSFSGFWGSRSYPRLIVAASDELLNALLEKDITIRVLSQVARIEFPFPDGFPEAYARLSAKDRMK